MKHKDIIQKQIVSLVALYFGELDALKRVGRGGRGLLVYQQMIYHKHNPFNHGLAARVLKLCVGCEGAKVTYLKIDVLSYSHLVGGYSIIYALDNSLICLPLKLDLKFPVLRVYIHHQLLSKVDEN